MVWRIGTNVFVYFCLSPLRALLIKWQVGDFLDKAEYGFYEWDHVIRGKIDSDSS